MDRREAASMVSESVSVCTITSGRASDSSSSPHWQSASQAVTVATREARRPRQSSCSCAGDSEPQAQ